MLRGATKGRVCAGASCLQNPHQASSSGLSGSWLEYFFREQTFPLIGCGLRMDAGFGSPGFEGLSAAFTWDLAVALCLLHPETGRWQLGV